MGAIDRAIRAIDASIPREVKPYQGHWAVFEYGKPVIHADTKAEAMKELYELEKKDNER